MTCTFAKTYIKPAQFWHSGDMRLPHAAMARATENALLDKNIILCNMETPIG